MLSYSLYEVEIEPYGDMFVCPEPLYDEAFFFPKKPGCTTVNAAGEAACRPTFTECTNVKNGTAVVKIGEAVFMLVVDAVS